MSRRPPRHPRDVRESKPETRKLVRRDLEVSRLASEAEGVLSSEELRTCGLSRTAVAVRVRNGRLHHGVYAVGHEAVSLRGRFLAAVKACGARAALSHLAAGAYWEMLEWSEDWPIDVTVAGVGTRRHQGLRVHRTSWLERRDLMLRDGFAVTAPWRTILDLAAVLSESHLRRVVRQALAEGLVSVRQLAEVLGRGAGRRGAGKLARVLVDAEPTRSELEDIVLDLLLVRFDRPEVNRLLIVEGRRLYPDFRWPEQRLVVEADGGKWHDNPIARADDARRQAALEASGERVERVTWRDATGRRGATLTRLEAAGAPLA